MKRTAVLGAGSWGTALAIHLARAGHDVRLWARDAAFVDELRDSRSNERYLPGVPMPDGVEPTSSLEVALREARFVVFAIPSHGLRAVAGWAAPHLQRGATFLEQRACV